MAEFPKHWRIILGVVAVILAWQFAAQVLGRGNRLFPTPTQTGAALWREASERRLFHDVFASGRRVILGMGIGAMVGAVLGVGNRSMASSWISEPILLFLRPIPPLAWIGLAVVWLGYGDRAAVFLVSLGMIFPIAEGVSHGLSRSSTVFEEVADTLGLTPGAKFFRVQVPQMLPSFLSAFRTGVGVSWMIVVAAEQAGVQEGLGYRVQLARALLQTDVMVAYMVVIGFCGAGMSWIAELTERFITPWRFAGAEAAAK